MSRMGWIRLVSSLGICVAVLAGCAINPVTKRSEISLVTPAQELEIGKQGYPAVIQEFGLYNDDALQAYVNTVGQKVARVSDLPNLEWHFTVLDDPTVNAFAMPGGYIYITRGILGYLNSEAQLAGVLGHEIGHVTHRHTASQITQQQLYGLGFGLASILSPTFQRYSGVAQQALNLLFLKYSRTDETQADELGVAYSTRAGYDSREIPATYATLERIDDLSGARLPGFLSTHPDPGNRRTVTAALAQQATAGKSGLVINQAGYVPRLDALVFGSDPRQGYFEGDHYFNPTLGFQLSFPAGWTHHDAHASVAAAEPNQAGSVQVSIDGQAGSLSPTAFVAQLTNSASVTNADGAPETIGGYAAWVGHIDVPQQGKAATRLAAGFIRAGATMFDVLGQSAQPGDANEALVFASMRSFRSLTDAARINVLPDRLRARKVAATGAFAAAIAQLGAASADLETNAILNGVQATDNVSAGALVKYVARGR
jgi:predicted Zn-dependent protease